MSPVRQPGLSTAEIRREARRRLVIGVSGLLTMLLLVLLAGLVTGQAREQAETATAQAAAAGVANPGESPVSNGTEPLADLGVAPALEPTAAEDAAGRIPAPRAAETGKVPMVPDLQPDPQLKNSQTKR